MAEIGSFDSLNPILYKGEAAGGLGLVYENLMPDSLDEPSTSYGLIAEWASLPSRLFLGHIQAPRRSALA